MPLKRKAAANVVDTPPRPTKAEKKKAKRERVMLRVRPGFSSGEFAAPELYGRSPAADMMEAAREISASDAINASLARLGALRADQLANPPLIGVDFPDIEGYTASLLTHGTAATHVGIDPAAPNGDHAGISVTHVLNDGTANVGVATAPEGLTYEALMRARRLLEENRVPEHSWEGVIGRHVRSPVEITFRRRHDMNRIEVDSRVSEFGRTVMLDEEQLRPENFAQIARDEARQFAAYLEEEVMRALVRAHERINHERYAANGIADVAAGYARHMDDMVFRAFTGRGGSKKTGVIASLEKLKRKTIEHNGWKAEVLDTHEKLTAEGESMSHCVAASYRDRIEKGSYVALHITAPEGTKLPKSGFTLGFQRREDTFNYDQLKGKRNDTHHCSHTGLLWFVDLIDRTLNGRAETFWEQYNATQGVTA